MQIAGKTAIVTGSSTGIGRATVRMLAAAGANVVINYAHSESAAREALAEVQAYGARALLCRADVSRDAEVRAMIQRTRDEFGGLHILVNNAGKTYFIPHQDLNGITEQMWDEILAVNLKGTFFCTRAAAGIMREAGEGCIINVSSLAGIQATGSSIAYAAAKAAIINLTVALARVLGPQIRVNCVAPGFIETGWNERGLGPEYPAMRQRAVEKTILGRVGTADDVAQAIIALITLNYVTGQTLLVDGGAGISV